MILVRESIAYLLGAYEMEVISFDSAVNFLRYKRLDAAACLVLDLQLPEMNGLDLQERLGHSALPIIFITGHGDISSSVRAMKAGAIEFLTKPVDREALVIAVRTALACDRDNRVRQAELAELWNRYSLLSPREREVLPLVVADISTSNPPQYWELPRSRCKTIAGRSCARWPQPPSQSWSACAER